MYISITNDLGYTLHTDCDLIFLVSRGLVLSSILPSLSLSLYWLHYATKWLDLKVNFHICWCP